MEYIDKTHIGLCTISRNREGLFSGYSYNTGVHFVLVSPILVQCSTVRCSFLQPLEERENIFFIESNGIKILMGNYYTYLNICAINPNKKENICI